jgi:hypothetical protein
MKRRGGFGVTVACVLTLMIVLAFGAVMVLGNSQSTSQGGSGGGIGSDISNGISLVKSGLQFAGGDGLSTVQAETVSLISDTFTGNAPIQPTCSANPVNSYIQLTNTGSKQGAAVAVTITYAGGKNTFKIAGSCDIGPSGSSAATTFVLFKGPSELPNSPAPQSGEQFSGSVAMSDGADLLFVGVFSSGYHIVKATAISLVAARFSKGAPTNSTCSPTLVSGDSYVMLNNTGTVGARVVGMTLDSGNSTNTIPVLGNCGIGPGGTALDILYILFPPKSQLNFTAGAGQPFNGLVSLDDRTSVSFQGAFA